MKYVLMVLCLTLAGVANAAKEQPKDANCHKVAEFANGIAKIKLAGYDIDALKSFVSEPKTATFPLQIVKQQIYNSDITPEAAYTKYYSQCVAVGYDALYEYYTHEHQRQQLEVDVAGLRAENVQLRNHDDNHYSFSSIDG
jgi:hypothetical protein